MEGCAPRSNDWHSTPAGQRPSECHPHTEPAFSAPLSNEAVGRASLALYLSEAALSAADSKLISKARLFIPLTRSWLLLVQFHQKMPHLHERMEGRAVGQTLLSNKKKCSNSGHKTEIRDISKLFGQYNFLNETDILPHDIYKFPLEILLFTIRKNTHMT